MKHFKHLCIAAVVTLGVGLGTAQAATIVNLDATKGTVPDGVGTDAATVTQTFAAGTYTIAVIDNTLAGGYNGYNYNTGPTVREAFDITIGSGPLVSFDVGSSGFTSYADAASALLAFATGPYTSYTAVGTMYDATLIGTQSTLGFTLAAPAEVTFGIPDHLFRDNTGGVSLAITAAVPEPETYAMMFAGLGALAFVRRRRSAA